MILQEMVVMVQKVDKVELMVMVEQVVVDINDGSITVVTTQLGGSTFDDARVILRVVT